MTVRENSILVAAEFPVTALQLEHRPDSILQQIYFLYKRLDWKWTTWKSSTDIFRNTYAKYSTEHFQMVASSYSKFIKLEEKIVNINARKLYGASMRYVWQRKSDFLPYSHAPWMMSLHTVPLTISYHLFWSWLANILLRKFDIPSKKICWKTKKCQGMVCRYKVAFFTMN